MACAASAFRRNRNSALEGLSQTTSGAGGPDLLDDSGTTEGLTSEMYHEGVQEPAGETVDDNLNYVLDALDQADYGHLKAIVKAAAEASVSSVEFMTGMLHRNKRKK